MAPGFVVCWTSYLRPGVAGHQVVCHGLVGGHVARDADSLSLSSRYPLRTVHNGLMGYKLIKGVQVAVQLITR